MTPSLSSLIHESLSIWPFVTIKPYVSNNKVWSRWEEGGMRLEIKLAIVKSGQSQWQIAQAIGVSEHALSKYIRGHGKLPPEKVEQLAALLEEGGKGHDG
jgi:hypothetical protein